MVRWEPGTPERLQRAALELFAAQGYEQTTAAEIAQAVGLTERTFFRHFSDKREVLFYGQRRFEQAFLTGLGAAPAGAAAMDAVAAALHSATTLFPQDRRDRSRTRQAVIDRNPALHERERHKLATLATAITAALRERGVDPLPARLAAESGVTVFGIAFAQWISDDEQRPMADIITDVLRELAALTPAVPA